MSKLIKATVDWREFTLDLPIEIREKRTQSLYSALRQSSDVETVSRIPDPNVPDGSMGAAWLTDLLLTEVIPGNFGSIFNFVRQRLPGTPINLKLEVDGNVVVIENVRPQDFNSTLDKVTQTVRELSGK